MLRSLDVWIKYGSVAIGLFHLLLSAFAFVVDDVA